MIDFGLLALFAVMLALVFLAFHAWRGIKEDGARIQVFRTDVLRDIDEFRRDLQHALEIGSEAKALAEAVRETHYKQLLIRIAEAEAGALAAAKIVDGLVSKTATLGGRVTAIQRWMKAPADAEEEPQQVEAFPVAPVPPPVTLNNGHFGRMATKRGG